MGWDQGSHSVRVDGWWVAPGPGMVFRHQHRPRHAVRIRSVLEVARGGWNSYQGWEGKGRGSTASAVEECCLGRCACATISGQTLAWDAHPRGRFRQVIESFDSCDCFGRRAGPCLRCPRFGSWTLWGLGTSSQVVWLGALVLALGHFEDVTPTTPAWRVATLP